MILLPLIVDIRQVEKVLTGFPANYAGLLEEDFLVSVQGQDIFELHHAQVVKLIKSAGDCLELKVER